MPDRKRPAAVQDPPNKHSRQENDRRQRIRSAVTSSTRETGVPGEGRLPSVVTCSCLFYEDCRAVADDFPERLPNSFQDARHYIQTFLPLLYEEARESIKSSYVECCEQDVYWDVTVASVQDMGGNWTRVDVNLGEYRGRPSFAPRLHQNITAVLSNVKPVKRDPLDYLLRRLKNRSKTRKHENSGMAPATALLTVVNQFDWETGRLKLLTKPICPAHLNTPTASCHLLLNHLRQYPNGWMVFPTGALVTQQRECDILHALDKIPVMDAILKPDVYLKHNIDDVPRKLPADVSQESYGRLHRNYDPTQTDAILMCTALFCKEEDIKPRLPIVLIQGPPGTGKTHTIEGILNLWHLIQFERFYKSVIDHFESEAMQPMTVSEFRMTRLSMRPRILVCAPSNAAVDELLERILNHQFRDSSGHAYNPNLVRLGAEDAPYSDTVLPVVLDTFVSSYFRLSELDWERTIEGKRKLAQDLENKIALIQANLLKNKQENSSVALELLSEMEELVKMETEISRLELVESVVRQVCPNERHIREALELNFLNDAEIVFTTLSSTGKKVLSKIERGFETVLIDEAAQASEVAALQPLVYGCKQFVLVGDPQQLPATIISQKGKELNMERSLFARLQEAGAPVKMLLKQYRMHPWIRRFPSTYFYDGQLEDGKNIQQRLPEAFYDHDLLKPYVVFDVPTGQHERQGGGSLQNQVEADLAVALFKELRDYLHMKSCMATEERRQQPAPVRVGVLTPYRSQTKCLLNTFTKLLGHDSKAEVSIMTVDSFQGKQLDVVIFSCVRGSSKASGVGFVADIRRMNVAITRARKALWILGNFRTLVSHPAWAALAADAKERECFVVKSTAESLFPHQKLYENILPRENLKPETTDPRLGVIKPLETNIAGEEDLEAEIPNPTEPVIEADNDVHNDALPCTAEEPDGRQDYRLPSSETAAAIQTPVVVEACSTSTAASATERDGDQSSNGNASGVMMVTQTGVEEHLGPSLGNGKTYLVIDTPSGLKSIPVSVLLNIQQGLPMRLMQPRSDAPQSDSQLSRLIRQWLG